MSAVNYSENPILRYLSLNVEMVYMARNFLKNYKVHFRDPVGSNEGPKDRAKKFWKYVVPIRVKDMQHDLFPHIHVRIQMSGISILPPDRYPLNYKHFLPLMCLWYTLKPPYYLTWHNITERWSITSACLCQNTATADAGEMEGGGRSLIKC